MRLLAADLKVGIEFDLPLGRGVEGVAVVDGLDAPDEAERHLVADVRLLVLLEAKVPLVDEVVALEDVLGFEELELLFVGQLEAGKVEGSRDGGHDEAAEAGDPDQPGFHDGGRKCPFEEQPRQAS